MITRRIPVVTVRPRAPKPCPPDNMVGGGADAGDAGFGVGGGNFGDSGFNVGGGNVGDSGFNVGGGNVGDSGFNVGAGFEAYGNQTASYGNQMGYQTQAVSNATAQ